MGQAAGVQRARDIHLRWPEHITSSAFGLWSYLTVCESPWTQLAFN